MQLSSGPRHLAFLVAILLTSVTAATPARQPKAPKIAGAFSLAAAGDALVTMRFSSIADADFLRMLKIIRDSDVALANLETLFHEFRGPAQPGQIGTPVGSNPAIARDLKWAGLDLLSRANNHAGDYGEYGLRRTTEVLEQAGLVHAGVGENLTEARRPAYLETPKGRVALISCASYFPPAYRAGNARGDVPGRPGLNPVRNQRTFKVTAAQLSELVRIAEEVGLNPPKPDSDGRLSLFRTSFETGASFQVASSPGSEWNADPQDVKEILRSIHEARRQADFVVVSMHAHEQGQSVTDPAPFLPGFARACVDAGADAFVGHGPHLLRGIEVYKGKPIFYSLGNLFFQNDVVERLPADFYERYGLPTEATPADGFDARDARGGFAGTQAYFESVLARLEYSDGRLVSVTLYPLTLGYQQPRSRRGWPKLASPADGRRIIDKLTTLSAKFGTRIEYRDGVGIIDVGTAISVAPR
jgi:poly-gamma-glutamate capsule biosynthesis protein CapA/YwtB (metallophosphatase superfamily)